jgi:hypothetical protein
MKNFTETFLLNVVLKNKIYTGWSIAQDVPHSEMQSDSIWGDKMTNCVESYHQNGNL